MRFPPADVLPPCKNIFINSAINTLFGWIFLGTSLPDALTITFLDNYIVYFVLEFSCPLIKFAFYRPVHFER